MAKTQKQRYADPDYYERKLEKVMERLGVDSYNFNWDRWECYVEFRYKGELHRFDHSIEKAKERGVETDTKIEWADET